MATVNGVNGIGGVSVAANAGSPKNPGGAPGVSGPGAAGAAGAAAGAHLITGTGIVENPEQNLQVMLALLATASGEGIRKMKEKLAEYESKKDPVSQAAATQLRRMIGAMEYFENVDQQAKLCALTSSGYVQSAPATAPAASTSPSAHATGTTTNSSSATSTPGATTTATGATPATAATADASRVSMLGTA